MKPIIIDMHEISDSIEVYNSKPNRAVSIILYFITFVLVVAAIWSYFFNIEVVVKSNGLFKGNEPLQEISVKTAGIVSEYLPIEGSLIDEGDTICQITNETLIEESALYNEEYKEIVDRLDALLAYGAMLNGDTEALNRIRDNQFFDEFDTRYLLLKAEIEAVKEDASKKAAVYKETINSTEDAIHSYENKIEKLTVLKQCLQNGDTVFPTNDAYCQGVLDNYYSSCNYAQIQYDNQISECNRQIDEYNKIISINEQKKAEDVSYNDAGAVDEAKHQSDNYSKKVSEINAEKISSINNFFAQQTASIEGQIEELKDTILNLNTSLENAKLQLNVYGRENKDYDKELYFLREKNSIIAEQLQYEEKRKSCEAAVSEREKALSNCRLIASKAGYFYSKMPITRGMYLSEGQTIGTIYPESESFYHAELYVENSDIAKLSEGQLVRFEIDALPSKDYNMFTGVISDISKDITIDQSNGQAYYVVRVDCDDVMVSDKEGNEISVMNGMACQGKIVVCEKSVLSYFLDKIDLLD